MSSIYGDGLHIESIAKDNLKDIIGERTLRIETYNPLPKQLEFHKAPGPIVAYVGGIGSGKTRAGGEEAKRLAFRLRGSSGLIVRKTFASLRESTIHSLLSDRGDGEPIFPRESYSWNEQRHRLEFHNGSPILFGGLDDVGKFGSTQFAWIWIDEGQEVTEEDLEVLIGRLRQNRSILQPEGAPWFHRLFLTANHVDVYHWIYKRFIENPKSGEQIIETSTYENKENLPVGYIERVESSFGARRAEVLLKGCWGYIPDGTPFYPEFRHDLHVKNMAYNPGLQIVRGWDFGFQFPACVIGQIEPIQTAQIIRSLDTSKQQTYVVRYRMRILKEFIGRNIQTRYFANKVIQDTEKLFYRRNGGLFKSKEVDWIDPAGNAKRSEGPSDSDTLRSLNLKPMYTESTRDTKRLRFNIVRQLLTRIYDNEPLLVIDKSCETLARAFEGGYHLAVPKSNNKATVTDDYPVEIHPYCDIMHALEYLSLGSIGHRIYGQKPRLSNVKSPTWATGV